MRLITIFIVLFFLISTCSTTANQDSCTKLSNDANTLFEQYLHTRDTTKIFLSYSLIKQALQCDSARSDNHWLMVRILVANGSYDSALSGLSNLRRLKVGPDVLVAEGDVYRKLGQVDSAIVRYNLALVQYNELLLEDQGNVSFIMQKAQLIFRLNGRDAAIDSLIKSKTKYPNLEVESLIRTIDNSEW